MNDTYSPAELDSSAHDIVKLHSYMALVGGIIPVPLIDLAAVTGLQIRMLSQLATLYGVPFSQDRGKAIIGSLVGGLSATQLAYGTVGSLVKAIPLVGWAAGMVTMPAMAYASTYALGRVFVTHFSSGGTILNFEVEKVRKHYEQEVAEARAQAPAAPGPAVTDATTVK